MKKDILLLGGIGLLAYFLLKGEAQGTSQADTGQYGGGSGGSTGGALSVPVYYVNPPTPAATPANSTPQVVSGYPPGYTPTASEAAMNSAIVPGLGYVKFEKSASGQWQGTSVFTPKAAATYMPTASIKAPQPTLQTVQVQLAASALSKNPLLTPNLLAKFGAFS